MAADFGAIRINGLRFCALPLSTQRASSTDLPQMSQQTLSGQRRFMDSRRLTSPGSRLARPATAVAMTWGGDTWMTQALHDMLSGLYHSGAATFFRFDDMFAWEWERLTQVDDDGLIFAASLQQIVPWDETPGVEHDWVGCVRVDNSGVSSGYTVHANEGLIVFDEAPSGVVELRYKWRGYGRITSFSSTLKPKSFDESCGKPTYSGNMVFTPMTPTTIPVEPTPQPGFVDKCYSAEDQFRQSQANTKAFDVTVRPTITPDGGNDWSLYQADYAWPSASLAPRIFVSKMSMTGTVGNSSGFHSVDQRYECDHATMPTLGAETTSDCVLGQTLLRELSHARVDHSAIPDHEDVTSTKFDWRFYNPRDLFNTSGWESLSIMPDVVLSHDIASVDLTITLPTGLVGDSVSNSLPIGGSYRVLNAAGSQVAYQLFEKRPRFKLEFNVPSAATQTWQSEANGSGRFRTDFQIGLGVDSELTHLPTQVEVRFRLDGPPTHQYEVVVPELGPSVPPVTELNATFRWGSLWRRDIRWQTDAISLPGDLIQTDVSDPASGFWPYQLPWQAVDVAEVRGGSGLCTVNLAPDFEFTYQGFGAHGGGVDIEVGQHITSLPQPENLEVRPVQDLEVLDPRIVLRCHPLGQLVVDAELQAIHSGSAWASATTPTAYAGTSGSAMLGKATGTVKAAFRARLHPSLVPDWYDDLQSSVLCGWNITFQAKHVGAAASYRVGASAALNSTITDPTGWPTLDANNDNSVVVPNTATEWTTFQIENPFSWRLSELAPTLADMFDDTFWTVLETDGSVDGNHVQIRNVVVTALFAPGVADVSV